MSPRKKQRFQPPASLRERAEMLAQKSRTDIMKMTPRDVQHLIYELQVHQIELQLQNEELRDAQIELEESRDRYSDLYEFAPVGYVTLDQKGKILESNLTVATMLGIERQALLRASLSKFVSRESQDEWHLKQQAAFASGETKQECEIEMCRADGGRFSVRLEMNILQVAGALRCRAAVVDITQRKKAEEALTTFNKILEDRVGRQTAQIRLQAEAIAHLAEGVLITEGPRWSGSIIRFVNEATCRITGYAAHELIGQPRRILQGRLTNAELDRIDRELSAGNWFHGELVQSRKDGTAYDADLTITPLGDAAGRYTKFVSIHRDISERKRSDEALRASEQRFRQMADHAPVMIWMSGIDKSCTWFNRPRLEFTGRSMDQELGKGWLEGVHPDDLKRCFKTYLNAFDSRQPFTMEYRLRRHDGQWRWVLDNGIPLYQETGSFAGYIGSSVDITGRKQTEQELDQYRKDLKTMASELMLTEERERQRLAEDLHDGLGQALFRARMKLDQISIVEPRAKEVATILEEVSRMTNAMTFELSPPVLRKLGLRPALRSLVPDMQQRYSLSVHVVDDGKDIPLDQRVTLILFRSVRELLINVVKHARTNRATLSLRRVDNHVQLEIRDRGKGFVPADQSRHVESGHFGLFSIRERLEYMGGTLNIRSAPGKGTSITLVAPLATRKAARRKAV